MVWLTKTPALVPLVLTILCVGCGDDSGVAGTDGGGGDDAGSDVVDCAQLSPNENTVAPEPLGALSFPTRHCDPSMSGRGSHMCCSDDPAAIGGLPDYSGLAIGGELPLFSGENNGLSRSGMCVNTSDIPAGSGLQEQAAPNCPIPCNPTWTDDEIRTVCGSSRMCCQTRELQALDCLDDGSGPRPARGSDIAAGLSNWASDAHATHQDPNGNGCQQLADAGTVEFEACVEELSVADQRGYCMAVANCPHTAPTYVDACEAM